MHHPYCAFLADSPETRPSIHLPFCLAPPTRTSLHMIYMFPLHCALTHASTEQSLSQTTLHGPLSFLVEASLETKVKTQQMGEHGCLSKAHCWLVRQKSKKAQNKLGDPGCWYCRSEQAATAGLCGERSPAPAPYSPHGQLQVYHTSSDHGRFQCLNTKITGFTKCHTLL